MKTSHLVLAIIALLITATATAQSPEGQLQQTQQLQSYEPMFSVHFGYNMADSVSSDEFSFQSGATKTNGSSKSEIDKGIAIGVA